MTSKSKLKILFDFYSQQKLYVFNEQMNSFRISIINAGKKTKLKFVKKNCRITSFSLMQRQKVMSESRKTVSTETWRIKMESDTEWEDQLKAYFADHNGQTVIKSTLQIYFETNRSQNKTQQQEQSKILSVEFNAADVLATCTALYGRLIGDSYSTLIRCHELLNCSKEPFSTQFSPLPVLRYV